MQKLGNIPGKVVHTKVFFFFFHRITQARIKWDGHPHWPQCFTWVDNRQWPYHDQDMPGHARFPEKYWIRKIIKRWYGEQTKQ